MIRKYDDKVCNNHNNFLKLIVLTVGIYVLTRDLCKKIRTMILKHHWKHTGVYYAPSQDGGFRQQTSPSFPFRWQATNNCVAGVYYGRKHAARLLKLPRNVWHLSSDLQVSRRLGFNPHGMVKHRNNRFIILSVVFIVLIWWVNLALKCEFMLRLILHRTPFCSHLFQYLHP